MTADKAGCVQFSARHAMYVGWLVGRARERGIDARPILDDAGDYTASVAVCVELVPGVIATSIALIPPPPEDWTP